MNTITASEAIYGFAAWLTCRSTPVTLSAKHDSAIAAELAAKWCQANNLEAPREDIYPTNITQPAE